jgi:hypothetical protein
MFVSVENYINSINPTGMGADRCRIIEYYGLSDGTSIATSSYRQLFVTAHILESYN